jgi:protein KRI1
MPKDLLSDESSDSDDGGAKLDSSDFKVNQDFARKFEYNKKREEKQRRMYLSSRLILE